MKKILSLCGVAILAFGLAVGDADAKRFGGGGNVGKQRTMNQQHEAAPPAKPAQAPAAAPNQAQPHQQPAAPAQSGASKWLGPLAGLAAGGLLASLFMGGGLGGLGGAMGSILMVLALVVGVLFIVRMLRKPQPQPMQYAGMGEHTVAGMLNTGGTSPAPVLRPEPTAFEAPAAPLGSAVTTPASSRPEWFQDEPFLREAKKHFIRLQADYDSGDLGDIREYVTPEMYAEIVLQLKERGAAANVTEVVKLDAEIVEVATENNLVIASVRFSGQIREEAGGGAHFFNEIWHIQKALDQPSANWFVAGIQQD